ncbi:MAG: hypothetical protein AAF799_28090 [Myxococcota bacterium]
MSNAPWVGIWNNEALGIQLSLELGGTFGFVGPTGSSTGRFEVRGDQLWFQEANGNVLAYRIARLDEQTMDLLDAMGTMLHYRRSAVPSLARGQVLAEAGGLQLTEGEVDVGLDLVRLLIDTDPSAQEREALTQHSVDDFRQHPAAFLEQLRQIAASVQQVRALRNPTEVALARQAIFASLYAAVEPMEPATRPPLMQVVLSHVQVRAFDPRTQLLCTSRDLAGAVALAEFEAMLAGRPLELTPQQRTEMEAELVTAFQTGGLEVQQRLCVAGPMWAMTEANWSRFDEAQREQLRAQFRASFGGGAAYAEVPGVEVPEPEPASAEPPTSAVGDAYAARVNAETFRIMQEMSLQHHATTLNIIENMGGTGNYWEVV